ncbi:MAG: high-potential iron-sulfur protein [Steroidobacteraceae bacterium]
MAPAISRRRMIKSALAAGTLAPAVGLFGTAGKADTLTPLDINDPSARALNFVPDAAKIDVRANPTYKAGQHCGLCAHYRGKQTDLHAGCEVFTNHSVPASGWCLVWGARAG